MQVIAEKKDEIVFIKLIKEFSINNIRDVESVWEQLKTRDGIIVFDCIDLDFIDSSAIGTLVKFLNDSRKMRIDMVIINVNSSIEKIFKTAKLHRLLNILTLKEFESKYLRIKK